MNRSFTPYSPGERSYPLLSKELASQLAEIAPTEIGAESKTPCRVRLSSGKCYDHVYLMNSEIYISSWGAWPEDDPGKSWIDLNDVVSIEASPDCLPLEFAEKLSAMGETSMGGVSFYTVFDDGTEQLYETGNAIDFIEMPKGKSFFDIKEVKVAARHERDRSMKGLDYFWCLYST